MKKYLEKHNYPGFFLPCVDYKDKHNDSFEINKDVVGEKASKVTKELFDNLGIVCNKVDVIGHSMGGLLTKKYIQNNGSELFRKVITINTPHGGSQLGNFVTDPTIGKLLNYTSLHWLNGDDDQPFLVERRALLLGLSLFLPSNSNVIDMSFEPQSSIYKGAVYDLSVNGEAINSLNTIFGNTRFHSIVTKADPYSISAKANSLNSYLGYPISLCLGYGTVNEFLNELFNHDESDLVVPLLSQYGGLLEPKASKIDGPWHVGSCDENSVMNEVLFLLTTKTSSSVFSNSFLKTPHMQFDKDSFKKKVENIYPKIFEAESSHSRKPLISSFAPTISNSEIGFNLYYELGDAKLRYKIIDADKYNNIAFACIIDNNLVGYTKEPEGTIDFLKHMQGNVVVMCEGENKATGGWEFASDTVQIRTFADSDLERIEFVQDSIYAREADSISVYVMCYWNDGTTTNLENPNLSISSQQIASVEGNYVKAKQKGETTIKASYLGKECTAQVVVFNTRTDYVSLYEEEDYGFTSNQIIFYNIKPDEGGSYFIHPAATDNVVLSEQKNGNAVESVSIDRATGNNRTLYFRYTPYNSELSDAKFQYGVICRNVKNGHCYARYGGSTNNLYGQALPPGAFYSQSVSMSFSTSIIPYNGKYEVLPAYSLDNGTTWEVMYYNVSQKLPIINIVGGENEVSPIIGDVNSDYTVDVADIATVISVMAGGSGIANSLQQTADVNGDGVVDVADIATIINEMAARARRLQERGE